MGNEETLSAVILAAERTAAQADGKMADDWNNFVEALRTIKEEMEPHPEQRPV